MLARVVSLPWLMGGAVVLIGLAVGGAYLKGQADGRAVIAEQLQADRITILKDGKKIDDEVLRADDFALCELLGGCLPDRGAN